MIPEVCCTIAVSFGSASSRGNRVSGGPFLEMKLEPFEQRLCCFSSVSIVASYKSVVSCLISKSMLSESQIVPHARPVPPFLVINLSPSQFLSTLTTSIELAPLIT